MVQATRSERSGFVPPGPLVAGRPHRWQYRACGDSSARQEEQDRGMRLAPQPLQKLPDALAPQAGQVCGVELIIGGEA
jgi:hypothetical protein